MTRITTRMSRMCLASAMTALLAGCPEPDSGDAGVDPVGLCSSVPGDELQVGTAPPDGEGFLAFEDGEEVELATAGQGGFHVFVSYAVRGFDPEGLLVHRSVSLAATGETLTANPERVNLLAPETPAEDTYCTLRTAQYAILCPSPVGHRIWDAELELDVEIEDAAGKTAWVTRGLRAVCPQGELREDCVRICDGTPVE